MCTYELRTCITSCIRIDQVRDELDVCLITPTDQNSRWAGCASYLRPARVYITSCMHPAFSRRVCLLLKQAEGYVGLINRHASPAEIAEQARVLPLAHGPIGWIGERGVRGSPALPGVQFGQPACKKNPACVKISSVSMSVTPPRLTNQLGRAAWLRRPWVLVLVVGTAAARPTQTRSS